MAIISSIKARKILDSRGEWTIETSLFLESGFYGRASVPQGKSVGINAVKNLPAEDAVLKIENEISKEITGEDFKDIKNLDKRLLGIDSTEDKSNLGGNSILSLSIAFAKALAKEKQVSLVEILRSEFGEKNIRQENPRILANLINGGLHAGNNLAFQEHLVIPKEQKIESAINSIISIRDVLKEDIEEEFGAGSMGLGDEGGFAPPFSSEEKPFEFIQKAIEKNELSNSVDIGADFAAENIDTDEDKLFEIYKELEKKFNLFYMEDPFGEEEFDWFSKLLNSSVRDSVVVGDDLTTTNVERMKKAKSSKSINAVLIKPNQIGSITETLRAVKFARENGWFVFASHRSGETNDSFIADFAFAVGADGVKIGAPARGERIAKYNRLLEIET